MDPSESKRSQYLRLRRDNVPRDRAILLVGQESRTSIWRWEKVLAAERAAASRDAERQPPPGDGPPPPRPVDLFNQERAAEKERGKRITAQKTRERERREGRRRAGEESLDPDAEVAAVFGLTAEQKFPLPKDFLASMEGDAAPSVGLSDDTGIPGEGMSVGDAVRLTSPLASDEDPRQPAHLLFVEGEGRSLPVHRSTADVAPRRRDGAFSKRAIFGGRGKIGAPRFR